MKITLSWLKRFLTTNASIKEIADKLTMIGLEVESIDNKAEQLKDFEVAKILEAHQHPDADKLRVCKVLSSKGELQIVCGAPNARAGIKVVLANVGVEIPNGNFKIKQSKIRGVESQGMLCSLGELNLPAGDDDGIIELPIDAQIGDAPATYLGVDDVVVDVNVTPNRADCLGVYGIARDLAASGIGTLKALEFPKISASFACEYSLKVNDPACALFNLREIRNVKNGPSPKWLQDLLSNAGIGSISAIVDIVNYVSHSFSQPMHAYNASLIQGGLIVEKFGFDSGGDVNFTALNDKIYNLHADDLIIKDTGKIQCLAGVIGSASSACSLESEHILLEAAIFEAKAINNTGKRHSLDTDSRHRFERYVDGAFTRHALEIATTMIIEICGGQASDVVTHGTIQAQIREIRLDKAHLHSLVGISLPDLHIITILSNLGFSCLDHGEHFQVTVPSWRYDVNIAEDLLEEIVRINGYDNLLEIELPMARCQVAQMPKYYKRISDLKRLMAHNGYQEIVSWSFMDSKIAANFTSSQLPVLKDELYLDNPISLELNYMRPSIIPNLLQIAQKNLNRSIQDFSIFELGPVFLHNEEEVINHLSGMRIGYNLAKNPHKERRLYDIFDIKADISEILLEYNLELDKCKLDQSNLPGYYHPTRSAAIYLGRNRLGYFGQIHPIILQKYKIDKAVIAFEIILNALPATSKSKGSSKGDYAVSNYQSVTRDYAFIVDVSVPAGEVINMIRALDRSIIKKVELFDIYQGQIKNSSEEGFEQKSLAISVTLQDQYKTLTELELTAIHDKIVKSMADKYQAKLRG